MDHEDQSGHLEANVDASDSLLHDEPIQKQTEEALAPAKNTQDPIDPKVQSGVRKLPTELRDDIFDKLLAMCLSPGKILIEERRLRSESDTGLVQSPQPLDPSILPALDRPTVPKALKMMYGENKWVVGQCSGQAVKALMGSMSPNNRALIRFARIELSSRDSSFVPEDEEAFVERKMRVAIAEGSSETEMHFRARHWLAAHRAGSDLMLNWLAKFEPFCCLKLSHLTVDVRNATDFHGHFRGLELVQKLSYFSYAVPNIRVLAPTEEDEAAILEALERVTGSWF